MSWKNWPSRLLDSKSLCFSTGWGFPGSCNVPFRRVCSHSAGIEFLYRQLVAKKLVLRTRTSHENIIWVPSGSPYYLLLTSLMTTDIAVSIFWSYSPHLYNVLWIHLCLIKKNILPRTFLAWIREDRVAP